MELVEGETLRSLIQRGGPLPIARAADLTRQIADALGAAHHLGIVHRDLKPDNILVTKHHDGADWVKVVDFGIAKTVQGSGGESRGGQTVTTAGVSLGTPEYMSPEQLAGERLDARTDLYSLGLVLFNMLTANLPYPPVTSKETLVRRLTSKPQTLAEVVPSTQWPGALQSALDRALAPEPVDRYASVGEFGRDVAAAASGANTARVPAMPPHRPTPGPTLRIDTPVPRSGPTPTMASASRRRPKAIAGALLVLAAASAGAFVALRPRDNAASATTPASVVAASQSAAPAPAGNPAAVVPSPDSAKRTATSLPSVDSSNVASGAKSEPTAPKSKSSSPTKPAPTGKSLAESAPAPITAAADTVVLENSPPVNPADTTPANRDKAMKNLRHAMLRASGDTATAAAMPATDPERIHVMSEDIQGHMQRVRQFVQQGDIPKARGEIREMGQVIMVLRQLYGGTPAELRVEQALRFGTNQTIAECRAALQDSITHAKLPSTFRCEQLLPLGMRGQRGGRSPSPWNR
jgi:serine/threonine-protein kinase